jgi:hypothetical protein
MAELLYGTRLRDDKPSLMAAVRAFLARISVYPWDDEAGPCADSRRCQALYGVHKLLPHDCAPCRMTMVTRDAAIRNLKSEGLKIVSW